MPFTYRPRVPFSCLLACVILVSLGGSDLQAQGVPDSLSFQGFVTDAGGTPLNATVPMTFKLYKNGDLVVTETLPAVSVTNGVFNVTLGGLASLEFVSFNQPIELGITVDGDPEIVPRTPLLSAPFALGMRGMYATWSDNGFRAGYNIVGGAPGNSGSFPVAGATISGGGGTHSGLSGPNRVIDDFGTIGGGWRNTVSGRFATVGGGGDNAADGNVATIGGGSENRTNGVAATVPGGLANRAAGHSSLAAGYHAKALHDGTFVWNDRSVIAGNDSLLSTAPNQFLIRAAGGVAIGTNSPRAMLTLRGPNDRIMGPSLFFFGNSSDQTHSGRIRFVEGTAATNHRGAYIHYNGAGNDLHIGVHNTDDTLAVNDVNIVTIERDTGDLGIKRTNPDHPIHVGSDNTSGNGAHVTDLGVWTNGSSRTFKGGFEEIDKSELLNELAELKVTKWYYHGEEEVRHIGPTAEDFRAAFALGHDERYITTVDADGVALAAIQGLLERLVALEMEVSTLRKELAAK